MKLKNPPLAVPPELTALGGLWITLSDLALAALALLAFTNLWAPPQDLAWKPLALNQPVGMATGLKFSRAASDPALCRKVLTEGGFAFSDVEDRTVGSCTLTDIVKPGPQAGLLPASPPMTCPETLAYAFWRRHTVDPAAEALLGAAVRSVDHYGTYACRNIYGRAEGRLSQHARANALDVAGFRLADGRRLTVAGDFRDEGQEGQFMRAVRTGACDWFRGVLSPDYNAAHRDHLHLDFGPYGICR